LQLAEDATATAPASAQAWFALGEVSRKTKNDAKALEAYAKAAQFDGSWSTARLAYADALVHAGGDSVAQAAPEYEAVLTLSQNDADVARARKTLLALKKSLK
jgi:cytochrome c-type biogenesis protein CcmH/NrfG